MTNLYLIIVIVLFAFLTLYLLSFRNVNISKTTGRERYDYNSLKSMVSKAWNEKTSSTSTTAKTQAEKEKAEAEAQIFKETTDNASKCDPVARSTLIASAFQILCKELESVENLDNFEALDFNDANMMLPHHKFETIYYFYQKELLKENEKIKGTDKGDQLTNSVLVKMLEKSGALDLKKQSALNHEDKAYIMTKEELDTLYTKLLKHETISVNDALHITARLIYQDLIGIPVIDSLLYDESFTSLLGGYTGTTTGQHKYTHSVSKSLIVKIPGKKVYLPCLEFPNERVYKNAVMGLTRNHVRTFTISEGILSTSTRNNRRISVITTSIANSFAFNVRIPDVSRSTNGELLKRQPRNRSVYNSELIDVWLWFLGKALMSIVFTGGQGAGKSTHLNSFIGYLSFEAGIRILANIDETNANFKYPHRDVKLFKYDNADDNKSIDKIAAISKRSDGDYLFITEVLNEIEGKIWYEQKLSGWLGVSITAHGATPEAVTEYMTDLVDPQASDNKKREIAGLIETVMKFNKLDGLYTMENFSEIIPRDSKIPWKVVKEDDIKDMDSDEALAITAYNNYLYQKNSIDKSNYSVNEIFTFNRPKAEYQVVNPPSNAYLYKILSRLDSYYLRVNFRRYCNNVFKVDPFQVALDEGFIVLSQGMTVEEYFGEGKGE